MIDIIGNIRIDESKPERVQYFVSTILSYQMLFAMGADVYLCINEQGPKMRRLMECLEKRFPNITFADSQTPHDFGRTMHQLLSAATLRNPDRGYYIHFEEDHFLELDSSHYFLELLGHMRMHSIQVCRSSFHKIELDCQRTVQYGKVISEVGYVFEMDWRNFQDFQGDYPGGRYFLGTNCIFSRQFAWKFWKETDDGNASPKPHAYERSRYKEELKHRLIIPRNEILRSIDDDHGLMGSSMALSPSAKYKRCATEAKQIIKNYYK